MTEKIFVSVNDSKKKTRVGIEIPKQLHNHEFRFVKIRMGTKKPFENEWTTKNNYRYNQVELTKWLKQGGNYGVLCGHGDLVVVDIDNKNFDIGKLPETFMVRTGGGGRHFYYACPNIKQSFVLQSDGKHFGEVQAEGRQVVGPGSLHPSGKTYLIESDREIAKISKTELKKSLGKLFVKETTQKTIVLPKSESKQIPQNIKELIENGVEKGLRDRYTWTIVKELYSLGYDPFMIRKSIIDFNSKCKPPRDILEVEKHLEHLLRNTRYLDKKITEEQMEKLQFGMKEDVIMEVEDIMSEKVKPIDWLVKDWIPTGSQTLLCGKAGSFKSYIAQYLAICLGTGEDFLGFETKRCKRILILDMENSKELWNERFNFLKKGMGIKEKMNISIWAPDIFKLTIDKDYQKLLKHLKEGKYDTLLIDALVRVSGVEENKAEEVSKLYIEKIKPLISNDVIENLIIIHHLKKAIRDETEMIDLVRGSTDWVNQADTVIGLRANTRIPNKLYMHHLKLRRRKKHTPISIELDADEPQTYARFIVREEDVEGSLTQECYMEILRWIEEEDIVEFTTGKNGDLAQFSKEKNGRYKYVIVDKARKLLENDGKIQRITRGRYLTRK